MPYAILRFAKKSAGKVASCYAHNERKKEVYKSNPDINPERKSENYHLVLPKQTYLREWKRLTAAAGCRVKSNSTVMVETLITASPEFMNTLPYPEQREFFERALAFVESKVGKENIISAVVHMDESTPHMHLVFCPITGGKKPGTKSLSAKEILGNRASLSKWQTEYHACMSKRFPELERGLSSLETGRKHIPLTLFKQAERLDKQIDEIEAAINDIGVFNAGKKRDEAAAKLRQWLPRAMNFTAKVSGFDEYIKELEQKEAATLERIKQTEQKAEQSAGRTISALECQVAEKDKEILAAQREAYQSADKLRRQASQFERIVGRLPLEMRTRITEEAKKIAAQNAAKNREDKSR